MKVAGYLCAWRRLDGMNNRFDVLVLGAGIVGVSVALHLQERGLKVALIDRNSPGRETSYGNAGFIESSAILPHPFPKGIGNMLRFALNRSDAVRTDYAFLSKITPWLLAYKRASSERRLRYIGPAFRSLTGASLAEHRYLMEKAGTTDLLREDGWLELCRTPSELDEADRAAMASRKAGVSAHRLDTEALHAIEPALTKRFAGAIHWVDTARITDPGGLVSRLADFFTCRGGINLKGNAFALRPTEKGWSLPLDGLLLRADQSVVALGPWSAELAGKFGYHMPLVAKRGYHQHFDNCGQPPLTRPVYVRDRHCLIVPTVQGIRVMTGVELAPRDAAPAPSQLARMVACARETVTLGPPVEDQPWLGARPCMPDMLPVIGESPRHHGLWFAFGHGHYGLTHGPVTGRLIAELMTSQKPLVPVEPFSPARFEKSGNRPEMMAG